MGFKKEHTEQQSKFKTINTNQIIDEFLFEYPDMDA